MSVSGKVASGTFYMPPEQMEAWFSRAKPGAKIAYARGPGVDARSGVAATAQQWAASGEAELFKTRDPGTGELMHCIKRKQPAVIDEPGARRVRVDDTFRESPEGKIFLTLVRCANLDRPCPSNAELADIAGLRDADAARYVLHEKLVKNGRIELRHDGAGNAQRRARIIETGKWTAAVPIGNGLGKRESGR